MNRTITVILSIIFFLLLGTLVALYSGWWRPYGGTIKNPGSLPVLENNQNGNTPSKTLIKRSTVQSYDSSMKEGDQDIQQGAFQEALNSFIAASQMEPAKLEPYLKIGEAYYYLDNSDKAQENFEYILKKEPQNERASIFLARTFIKKSDFLNALNILLSLSPENQEVRYYIGLLRLLQEELDKGQNNLQQAADINNQSPTGQKAQNVLNNIAEFNLFTDGKNVHLKTLIGRSFAQNGEYQLAIEQLKNVLKENKQYRDAWIMLGFSYYMVQKYDLSIETLNNAYDLDPEKAETQYFLGLSHAKMTNNDKALTYLILALKNGFEPRIEVQKRIADLYLTNENYDEALSTYQDIIKENQANDINLYVRPIWILLELKKQPVEALELAKQALTKYPDQAMSYNLVGWSYLGSDELAAAQENLDKAMQMDPNLQAVYLNQGDLYFKRGDSAKARDFYERAYFIDKTSAIGGLAATKYNALVQQ